MKPLIVGIDPGTTSAYAAVDFDLNVIGVGSKKDFPASEIISSIFYLGDPVILATDKKDIPSFVKTISQKLGTKIYTPNYDLKKGEKKRIVQEHGFSKYTNNWHEIDSLGSAIFAYREYLALIRKIKNSLKKKNHIELIDDIIPLVFLDEMSIAHALEAILKKDEKVLRKIKKKRTRHLTPPKTMSEEEKHILLLRTQNLRLLQENEKLQESIRLLEHQEIDLDKESIKKLGNKEKKILYLEKKAKKLNKKVRKTKKVLDKYDKVLLNLQGKIVLKRLRNLSKEEFKQKQRILDIKKSDKLMIDDISVVSNQTLLKIQDLGINTIFFRKKSNQKLHLELLLVDLSDVNLQCIGNVCIAISGDVKSAIRKSKENKTLDKSELKEILEDYRRKRIS